MDINKIIAKLPTGFVDDASGMNGDQLRTEIIKAETSLREVDFAQKGDEKLTGARDIVKDIVGGYNDAKKAQRAKIAYTLHLLEERGELGTGQYAPDEVEEDATKAPGAVRSLKKADAPRARKTRAA